MFVCPYSEVSNSSPCPNSITTKKTSVYYYVIYCGILYILSSLKVRSRVIDCMRGVWRYISPRFVGRGCSNRLSQQYQQYNLCMKAVNKITLCVIYNTAWENVNNKQVRHVTFWRISRSNIFQSLMARENVSCDHREASSSRSYSSEAMDIAFLNLTICMEFVWRGWK